MPVSPDLRRTYSATEAALAQQVIEVDHLRFNWPGGLRFAAGVNIVRLPDGQHLLAMLAIVDWSSMELVYEAYAVRKVPPGGAMPPRYRASLEAQPAIEVVQQALAKHPELAPQLLFLHGSGRLFPGGYGVACHVGVAVDLPTVGVTTHWEDVDQLRPAEVQQRFAQGEEAVLLVGSGGAQLGVAYRPSTDPGAPTVYVSVGHRVSLATAFNLVQELSYNELPLPVEQAIQRAKPAVRQYATTAGASPTSVPRAIDDRRYLAEEARIKGEFIEEDRMAFCWFDTCQEQPELRYVAGVDLAYVGDRQHAVVTVVVVDWETQKAVYRGAGPVEFSAAEVPQFQAFREAQPMIDVLRETMNKRPDIKPQLIYVHGTGKFHRRNCGVAVHVGVELGIATIGIATTWQPVDGLDFGVIDAEVQAGAEALALRDPSGDLLGFSFVSPYEMETTRRPMFVSVGHMIGIYTAVEITKTCSQGSLPEPLALAIECSKSQAAEMAAAPPPKPQRAAPAPPMPHGRHAPGAPETSVSLDVAVPPVPSLPKPPITPHDIMGPSRSEPVIGTPRGQSEEHEPKREPAALPPRAKNAAGRYVHRSVPPTASEEFIPVREFGGQRPGYRFRQGPQGLGYYAVGDRDAHGRSATPSSTAPPSMSALKYQDTEASDVALTRRMEQLRQSQAVNGRYVDEEVLRSQALLSMDNDPKFTRHLQAGRSRSRQLATNTTFSPLASSVASSMAGGPEFHGTLGAYPQPPSDSLIPFDGPRFSPANLFSSHVFGMNAAPNMRR